MGPPRVLCIADSVDDAAWVAATLGGDAARCTHVESEEACRSALAAGRWDAAVSVADGTRLPPALNAFRGREARAGPPLLLVAESFVDVADEAIRLGAAVCLRGQGRAHLGPAIERAASEGAERERQRSFEEGQREVLEQIASGAPLPAVLESCVLLVERQAKGMVCTILMVDAESGRVRHGAAPSLPRELMRAIDGLQIGPQAGSCGTAAYRRERVIVEDIGTHPYWQAYRHLVLPWGLRACWSSPIFAADGGEVLATFAMYYRESRGPTPDEERWVDHATHLAAIAISRDRAERAARQSDARYRQIVDTSYEGIWLMDAEARTLFVNARTAELLGYPAAEIVGRRLPEFMDEASRRRAEGEFLLRLRTLREQNEFSFVRKDGSALAALLSGSPIRDERNEVTGALVMLSDITGLKAAEEALRRSEAEFRVVFESAGLGMALLDLDGRPLRTNPALQLLLGYTEGELRERGFAELVHPDEAAWIAELRAELSSGTRDAYLGELRYVAKGGAVVWARVTASLVRGADGAPQRLICVFENVTERRRMEEAVRSSERLRTLMYAAVQDVLFYMSIEPGGFYRFLSVNPAFLRATGLEEHQVIGRLVQEVIPEPSLTQVLGYYGRAIAERRTVSWDEVSPYPAGTRYGEVSVTPVFDGDGQATNLVGTVHDVTERRLAQERLSAQAALLDKAKDAILVSDLDGLVRYWNKGAERLYGWSSEDAVGRSVVGLIYGDTSGFEEAQEKLVAEGVFAGDLVQQTRSGRQLVVEASWTLLRDADGQPRSVLAINTDISERRRLEARMLLAQRLESLGTLAGGIAHDFNNILTAILGNVRIAAEQVGAEHPAAEALLEVEKAGSRAAQLVRQILTFSRRPEPRRLVTTRLEPVVQEALKLLRATLPGQIRIETRFEPDVPEVFADATQIHQIVMNLGTNAAHAIGAVPGIISVRCDRAVLAAASGAAELPPGTYARLVVADTGSGMEEATLEHIFDPFFTTRETGQGTGLGLSVVHGIVKSYGGGIVVRSSPGKGTELALYFPEAVPQPAPEPQEAASTGQGEHVLCVDDEESVVRVETYLIEQLGYRATGFTDSERALMAFRVDPTRFDALITDVSMPGLSGPELVREIHRLRPGLPVVLTSGRMSPEDLRAADELGVRELVLKPRLEELGPALQRLLRAG